MNRINYFKYHVFFCLNERPNGEASCSQHAAKPTFDYCKQKIRASQLDGENGIRINKAGCLGRCEFGPVAVVYPEGVWYRYVDSADWDEIIESHLQNGIVVERLRIDTP